jgi:hypothetical protein
LVAVDSVAAPASSQFGAPPFLPNGPLSRRSSPEPSGSVEDGDNFDSSIPPPVVVFIKMTGPSKSTLPTVKVANE